MESTSSSTVLVRSAFPDATATTKTTAAIGSVRLLAAVASRHHAAARLGRHAKPSSASSAVTHDSMPARGAAAGALAAAVLPLPSLPQLLPPPFCSAASAAAAEAAECGSCDGGGLATLGPVDVTLGLIASGVLATAAAASRAPAASAAALALMRARRMSRAYHLKRRWAASARKTSSMPKVCSELRTCWK